MTKFRSLGLFVSLGACAALFLAGCEDPAAKSRAQVQADLVKATDSFQETVLASTGTIDDSTRSELRGILTTLTSASSNANAGPGQKAAAQSLAADVHRMLADAQLQTIDELRAQNRVKRATVLGMVSSAERLQVIATSLEQNDIANQVAMLKQARTEAEEALRSEQSEVASLQPSLNELEGKITEARQQVQGLREQENQLRRQAAELGYAKGFKTYEEAISVRRQADVIETSASYDELQRDFEVDPRVDSHQQRVEQIEAMIENIDIAIEELNENAASSSAMASTIRKDLNELVSTMTAEVQSLTDTVDNELKPAIEAAAQELSSAATKAGAAANTPTKSNAARLSAASANISLGQLHASMVREYEQRTALLTQLSNSSLPGMSGKFRTEITDAGTAKEQAVQEAVNAYNSAIELFDRIGNDNALALRADVEARVASLTGQPMPSASQDTGMQDTSSDMSSDMTNDASSMPMAAGPTGADSPEALAQALASMTTPETMVTMWKYQIPTDKVNFTSATQRQFAAATAASSKAMSEFITTVRDHFGPSAEQALQPMLMGSAAAMPKISGATVTSTEGERGEISITTEQGPQTVEISQIDGRWYLGTPDDFTGGFASAFDEMSGADGQQMQQIVQMMRTMATTMTDLTQRVQAGEFANPQALMMAFGQAMQAGMPK